MSTTHLTPRQIVVMQLLSADMPDKDVAECLGIGQSTVWYHVRQVGKAFGVRKRSAACYLFGRWEEREALLKSSV
ncbi:MAG: Bacterial regulatory protein luxR family [Verrucomicrobiales bacterium]|nr:Bacterial regulatory protein luxR family [Verrucomicrobiales bacterium]